MKNQLFLSAAIVSAMTLASCSKDNSTSPDTGTQANMTYELKATNTSSSTTQKALARGLFRWTSGYANPTLVHFKAKQRGTEIEYKSTNTTPIDLFAPTDLDFGGFMLPPGTYKEIDLKFRLNGQGSDPSLYLLGDYTYDGVVTPVEVRVVDEIWLKTEVKDVVIDENSSLAAITSLDLAELMDGVSDNRLRNAQLTNGTMIISRSSNRSIYETILRNIGDKRHRCDYKRHR